MSPRKTSVTAPRVLDALNRLRVQLGREVHEERRRRSFTLIELCRRAGVATSTVQRIEAGQVASLEAVVRVCVALGLEPQLTARRPQRVPVVRDGDPVHAAMGEVEAQHLATPGREMRLDEPYQHYQFAGRADLIVVDVAARALLHIENRTRFTDIQATAGAWNAKRAYLSAEIAQRAGMAGGWATVDHVMVALWSSEVLHVLRLRRRSFAAMAPDPPAGWAAWWDGRPIPPGTRSTLVLFDPVAGARRSRRRWVGLDQLDGLTARYRGYADTVVALRAANLV